MNYKLNCVACFLVPATEAIVTTVLGKAVKNHEIKYGIKVEDEKIPLSKKINRLSGFLWGGSGLLAFEHLWHGEITPYFPFLTAASDPEQMSEVLHEMSPAGVAMAAVVTGFWALTSFVSGRLKKPCNTAVKEAVKT